MVAHKKLENEHYFLITYDSDQNLFEMMNLLFKIQLLILNFYVIYLKLFNYHSFPPLVFLMGELVPDVLGKIMIGVDEKDLARCKIVCNKDR